jgi:hypothetical protein
MKKSRLKERKQRRNKGGKKIKRGEETNFSDP